MSTITRLEFKNEQDAMDVVQESVYKAMENASQIKENKYIKNGAKYEMFD